jgi:hypothetical protein
MLKSVPKGVLILKNDFVLEMYKCPLRLFVISGANDTSIIYYS